MNNDIQNLFEAYKELELEEEIITNYKKAIADMNYADIENRKWSYGFWKSFYFKNNKLLLYLIRSFINPHKVLFNDLCWMGRSTCQDAINFLHIIPPNEDYPKIRYKVSKYYLEQENIPYTEDKEKYTDRFHTKYANIDFDSYLKEISSKQYFKRWEEKLKNLNSNDFIANYDNIFKDFMEKIVRSFISFPEVYNFSYKLWGLIYQCCNPTDLGIGNSILTGNINTDINIIHTHIWEVYASR